MSDNPLLKKLDELKKKRLEEQNRAVAVDPEIDRDSCYGPTPVKRKKMKAKDRRRNRNRYRRMRQAVDP